MQQAAASGRPMAPGTKLMSPDGVIGIVTPNHTISLTLPPNHSQRVLSTQLQRKWFKIMGLINTILDQIFLCIVQNSKIPMRLAQNSRIVSMGAAGLHGSPVGLGAPQRMSVPTPPQPPPPPPPYPGPPPPYPGSGNQQVMVNCKYMLHAS